MAQEPRFIGRRMIQLVWSHNGFGSKRICALFSNKKSFKVVSVHDEFVKHPTLTFVLSLVRGSNQNSSCQQNINYHIYCIAN